MTGNKSRAAAPAAVIVTALGFMVLAALWLAFFDGVTVRIELPSGVELEAEYGSEYVDDAEFVISLPLIGELRLKPTASSPVDTHILGVHTRDYSASFFGRQAGAQRHIRVVDTTPPAITLLSRPDYQPDWMAGYQDEGVSAVDICDGDLSSRVELVRGDGYIDYRVTDAAGNESSARRNIEYMQNLPTLALIGPEELIISARPRYDDPGCLASAAGNDLTAYITRSGDVDSRRPGEYFVSYTLANPVGDSVSVQRKVTVAGEVSPPEAPPAERTVYLTFDDGPGPYTNELLELLEAYGAKATFFVTGANERYYNCIGRAHSLGHSIGVHAYRHNYGYIYASEENFFSDFNVMQQLIFEQTGEYTQLYRFPGGSSNTVSRFNSGIISRLSQSLQEMGYRYFDWNVNSGDAENITNPWTQAERVIYGCAGKQSTVVLFHDVKPSCVEAVEQVLIWGRENGYRFSALELSSPGAHHGIAN